MLLGEASALAPGRPLTHREIVAAVLTATRRALVDAPPSTQHVGERTPRPRVPRPRLHGNVPAVGVPGW
ncbi:hypothetical protein [Saccharomonospora saliphila]|uniref:hypothetical protein n=1 Tax=Saccharomonospora saliphila TaxID=369829 RepID=UPI000380C936|nr:hypothetical protein [Saccharomonospora saliphila]